ncbi:MAG: NAD(P)H-binding protein [Sphingomonadales bacterium]|nr:NAD(P)H-binding protein [Sphingomonadales bacterium]MBD3774855.1 NAD(P)H-binding protein [Paracoccaceae bacterium]
MTLAITGASGFVGQAMLDALGRSGREARALVRRIPAERPPGVEWISGSLSDPQSLDRLVERAEAVVHIAGLTNTPDPAQFETVNVDGTRQMIDAARRAGVPRFVFVSSLSAREPHLSAYGASKAKAEKLVAASGLDWTIVRPPAVYGPHDKDIFELFRAASWGVVPLPPPGRSSLIHSTDLAEALLALVPSHEEVTHRIFEPDDGKDDGWSHRELAHVIGWAVGKRPWAPHLSRGLLERAARVDRFLRRDKAKLTADRVGYMVHPDWVCSPRAHIPPAIWAPRIPTREGMKATAQWYREAGWL